MVKQERPKPSSAFGRNFSAFETTGPLSSQCCPEFRCAASPLSTLPIAWLICTHTHNTTTTAHTPPPPQPHPQNPTLTTTHTTTHTPPHTTTPHHTTTPPHHHTTTMPHHTPHHTISCVVLLASLSLLCSCSSFSNPQSSSQQRNGQSQTSAPMWQRSRTKPVAVLGWGCSLSMHGSGAWSRPKGQCMG